MIRTYSLVIEGDASGYSAHVPELPTVLVTGRTMEELTDRATAAVRLYLDEVRPERSATAVIREIEVELPA